MMRGNRMTSRETRKALTRITILDAAASLFAKRGFGEVTTADIAASAGISHGTIFAHFPTRNNLVVAVIAQFGQAMGKRLHDLAEARASLKTVLEAHLRSIGEHEFFYSRLVSEMGLLPGEAREHFIALQSVISHHLYRIAEREMRSGAILRMENDLLFNTWIGLLHYYLINRGLFVTGDSVVKSRGGKLLNHFLTLISRQKKEDRHDRSVHRLRNAHGKR